jgi:dolichyl-phosphate beta-glucosyltransferase
MTLVVPAFNEQDRLSAMLEEAVEYLEAQYGHHGTTSKSSSNGKLQANGKQSDPWRGWEILLVSDGSTDRTIATALQFAKNHQLNNAPPTPKGPWKSNLKPTTIPPGTIRVISLEQNRGKGGAVTHGMRHARGTYVVFADADGASRFSDLGGLVRACEKAKDSQGRAVGVGSRAHMVGTEAVVKVCPFSLSMQKSDANTVCSALSSATRSCTLSTYSSACSLHPKQLRSRTHNAASSCSPALHYPTSSHTCILRDGFSTWRC